MGVVRRLRGVWYWLLRKADHPKHQRALPERWTVEARLKEEGVPAFVCPPINMILYKIRELVGLAVEIADITVNQGEGRCTVRVVVFKQE